MKLIESDVVETGKILLLEKPSETKPGPDWLKAASRDKPPYICNNAELLMFTEPLFKVVIAEPISELDPIVTVPREESIVVIFNPSI